MGFLIFSYTGKLDFSNIKYLQYFELSDIDIEVLGHILNINHIPDTNWLYSNHWISYEIRMMKGSRDYICYYNLFDDNKIVLIDLNSTNPDIINIIRNWKLGWIIKE